MADGNKESFALKFKPWVPSTIGWMGLRVLIVAESHYDEGLTFNAEDEGNYTINTIRDCCLGIANPTRFFINISEAFMGPGSSENRAEFVRFWNSVAFCNYVQRFVKDRPKDEKVTEADIRMSDAAFVNVLEIVRPQAVLIMSPIVWKNMSKEMAETISDHNYTIGEVHKFSYSGGYCLMANTTHPSAFGRGRFCSSDWYPRVKEFLLATLKQA